MEPFAVLAVVAVLAWRWRRWPLVACWRCQGRGRFRRGRFSRRCRWCGGSGDLLRWGAKMTGRRR